MESQLSSVRIPGYIIRVLAVVLTLISAIVMGVAKETVTFTFINTNPGEPTTATGTVDSGDSPAFIYFTVINVIAFLYSTITLVISVAKRASSSKLELPFTVGDLLTAMLLFSCNSAAVAISMVAENGEEFLSWDRICNVVGKFCGQIRAAIVVSMFASVAYLLLVLLAIIGFYKRY